MAKKFFAFLIVLNAGLCVLNIALSNWDATVITIIAAFACFLNIWLYD